MFIASGKLKSTYILESSCRKQGTKYFYIIFFSSLIGKIKQRKIPGTIRLMHIRFVQSDPANIQAIFFQYTEPGIDFVRCLSGLDKYLCTNPGNIKSEN